MFVCSLKASRIKAFALTMLCAVVLGGALTLILGKAGRSEDLAAAAFSERNIKFDEKFARSRKLYRLFGNGSKNTAAEKCKG